MDKQEDHLDDNRRRGSNDAGAGLAVEAETAVVEPPIGTSLKPGERWKATEVHTVPHNNLKIVFPGIILAVFLAALDQTIAAVALPTIIKDLGGQSGYSWVGTAYLLASACMSPLYGKLSDIFGRKPVYFASIFLFLVGSALCGAAQSFLWLVLARGVQGAGGGGVLQLSMTTTSDLVPLDQRGTFLGIQGAMWGIASVLGPLVGGVLTDHASWRWCFWINLPTGALSAIILFMFLHLNPTPRKPIRQIIRDFDFLGLFLLVSGVACLLVGFNHGESSWSSPATIALVTVGATLLLLGSVNELFTSRSPIIPPRLFKTRTTAGILISAFVHSLSLFNVVYYIPVYFQVLGSSATMAGLRTMAYSLTSSVVAAVMGTVIVKLGYRPIIWGSWALMVVGFGLATMLDHKSSSALQEIALIVIALGAGGLFQVPLVALQAAMPLSEMATSTAAYMLLRTIGGTIGVSIGGAIFGTEVQKRLAHIPQYRPPTGFHLTNDVRGLAHIRPLSLRDAVLHAYSRSISTIWIVITPIVGVAFLSVLPMRYYGFQRTVVQAEKNHTSDSKRNVDAGNEPGGTPIVPLAHMKDEQSV